MAGGTARGQTTQRAPLAPIRVGSNVRIVESIASRKGRSRRSRPAATRSEGGQHVSSHASRRRRCGHHPLTRIKETGAGIFLVEQYAKQRLAIADRGYLLDNGHVTGADTAEALARDETVQTAYLGAD
jgi:hypothetical protein